MEKRTNSRIALSLFGAAALTLVAGTAVARPFGGGEGRGFKGKRLEMMTAQLALSDAQVQQIKAIRTDARARTRGQRDQVRGLHQQLQSLFSADVINEAQVVAVHTRLVSLKRVMGEERFQSHLKVMRLLTRDQRVKMVQMRGQHGRHGRGFGQGRGPQTETD